MLISTNSENGLDEFRRLLEQTTQILNSEVKGNESYFESRGGNKLEFDVFNMMKEVAKGGPFDNSIELVSGQKFPDIIAEAISKRYYGVEVKSTTQNHWKTTGNSVLESTRVEDVDRIFLLFGKLAKPIEFRYRTYEECLSEVVVTHSPRYLIDMNLEAGSTIFDKISMPYDTLRNLENPIRPIVDYYRSQLKEGEELWWIDSGNTAEQPAYSLKIRLWNTLSPEERSILISYGMVYFPEIFSDDNNKFNRLALWLVNKNGVVPTSLRDNFSAGGKVQLVIENQTFSSVPQIFRRLQRQIREVISIILESDPVLLSELWGRRGITNGNRIEVWKSIVHEYSVRQMKDSDVLIELLLREVI